MWTSYADERTHPSWRRTPENGPYVEKRSTGRTAIDLRPPPQDGVQNRAAKLHRKPISDVHGGARLAPS